MASSLTDADREALKRKFLGLKAQIEKPEVSSQLRADIEKRFTDLVTGTGANVWIESIFLMGDRSFDVTEKNDFAKPHQFTFKIDVSGSMPVVVFSKKSVVDGQDTAAFMSLSGLLGISRDLRAFANEAKALGLVHGSGDGFRVFAGGVDDESEEDESDEDYEGEEGDEEDEEDEEGTEAPSKRVARTRVDISDDD
jgi:hypothetical protein